MNGVLKNRVEAGKQLARTLKTAAKNAIVLAVPRGGVIVGYEVSTALGIPLDIIVTKKIGAPDNPELAVGAVAEDGTHILDEDVLRQVYAPTDYITAEVERQRQEIQRRLMRYRGNIPYPDLRNREVIIVDDGVATGSTLKAAIRLVRNKGARKIIVAVPVGPPDTIRELKKLADQVVALLTPEPFFAIGQFYADFDQTSDEEVIDLLKRSREKIKEVKT
ncbi:MAG: phosphoribosyltransferase [Chloroflexota bacterium]|nr:phosphoribosyltransferase [Candidatus Sulfotelmatobacter sp.]